MESEIWKPIKNWNGKYWISSHGRFKSIGGKYRKQSPEGYITWGYPDTSGYRSTQLRRPGVIEKSRIHVYVAEHFCLKIKGDECVNHLDGNKWNTLKGNCDHALLTGLFDLKGRNNPHVKLTESKVIEMRLLRKQGLSYQCIADRYGVCRRQASDVIRGVNWGWLATGL